MTHRSLSPEAARRRLLKAGAAGAALVASPFAVDLVRAQGASIKVGFLVPLTGPYAPEAQDQVRSAELAVKEFNDAGGFNGRKAELLVRDDKLNPGEAATRTGPGPRSSWRRPRSSWRPVLSA